MNLKATRLEIPELLLLEPRVFSDTRGFFLETYHRQKYVDLGVDVTFVQDNHSFSKKDTLRGLHYQLKHAQAKLVYVVRGEVYDIAVDIRRGSPTFGKWVAVILSSENKRQLYVPPGFAHGFCVTSETADVLYKCSDFYSPEDECGISWSDPTLAIPWPTKSPLLSPKDSTYPTLALAAPDQLPSFTA